MLSPLCSVHYVQLQHLQFLQLRSSLTSSFAYHSLSQIEFIFKRRSWSLDQASLSTPTAVLMESLGAVHGAVIRLVHPGLRPRKAQLVLILSVSIRVSDWQIMKQCQQGLQPGPSCYSQSAASVPDSTAYKGQNNISALASNLRSGKSYFPGHVSAAQAVGMRTT